MNRQCEFEGRQRLWISYVPIILHKLQEVIVDFLIRLRSVKISFSYSIEEREVGGAVLVRRGFATPSQSIERSGC